MVRNLTVNMASSPPSSTEATHFGTPSTSITAMSPDGCNSSTRAGNAPRSGLRISTSTIQSASRPSARNNLQLPAAGIPELSPTAEEFTPRTATFNPNINTTFSYHPGTLVSPVRNLVAGSMPDGRINTQTRDHGAVGQASTSSTVKQCSANQVLDHALRTSYRQFSNDENVTRTFQIMDRNIPSLHQFLGRFPSQFGSLTCIDNRHIDNGIVRLTFHDDRDAKQAYVLVATLTHPYCKLTQLTAKEVAIAHGKDAEEVSNYEGQLLVTVLCNSAGPLPTLGQFHEQLNCFGDVKALATIAPLIMNSITFRVEYHNVLSANEALEQLPTRSTQHLCYLAAPYEPDVIHRMPASTMRPAPAPSAANTVSRNVTQPSLTGRSTVPTGDYARLENVMARVMRESPSSSRGTLRTGHNVVDIGRIEAGIDVRTTIMLRNIPNKMDQANLKSLLDVTSFGEYDFMYLRIDFANNCNVGYAFINFVDPLAIIPFARARAGKRWNIFGSDKVAEISYATIQGRDCLIQKFRNSSVMLEHPSYCPKLFITRPSPFAGQEERFPDPDNYSKMRRSIDNAEHIGLYRPAQGARRQATATAPANVRTQEPATPTHSDTAELRSWPSFTTASSTDSGLFAPREGQAHREEQRRRRSQYDRGTPGAEIELSSYRLTDAALDNPRVAALRLAGAFSDFHL